MVLLFTAALGASLTVAVITHTTELLVYAIVAIVVGSLFKLLTKSKKKGFPAPQSKSWWAKVMRGDFSWYWYLVAAGLLVIVWTVIFPLTVESGVALAFWLNSSFFAIYLLVTAWSMYKS